METKETLEVLKVMSKIGLGLLCINVLLYFIGFFRNEKAYKSFTLYLLSICLIQFAMESFASQHYNNHFLSTYYLFFQFGILSIFFVLLFKKVNPIKSNIIKYSSIAICIGLLVQYGIYPELYYSFNSVGFFITSVLLIIYSVLYLYELLSQKLPFYYVTIGIFIYLISSALIFASAASFVTFNDAVAFFIWQVNAGLFILYQLLILWEWKQQFLPQITRQA
jgi:hypothetical protein